MARRPKGSVPSYCLHKQSGQAVFNWPLGGAGYQGLFCWENTAARRESHKEYERILAEWSASVGSPPPQPTGESGDLTM